MRFCYITTAYPSYLGSFYQSRPDLLDEPFSIQYNALLDDGFGRIGAWSATLPAHGYDVLEIVANAMPQQLAWARENGFKVPDRQAIQAIVLQQLVHWRAEVVFMDDPVTFPAAFISQLRSSCPSLRMVLGYSGSPTYSLEALRSYDILLSPTKSWVEAFQKQGCRCRHFAQAFNTSVLSRLPARLPVEEELLFVGGLVRARGYHLIREQLLEVIAKTVPLRIHSPSATLNPWRDLLDTSARRALYDGMQFLRFCGLSSDRLGRLPAVGRASLWNERPMRQVNPVLRPLMRPALFGQAFYTAQRKFAVTLNIHPDIAGQMGGNNMRIFEATGAGACLLTDANANLGLVFEVDREVVTFASAAECVEKGRWLLDHPREREAIAAAGQARTLRDHTYAHRATELDASIRDFIGANPARRA